MIKIIEGDILDCTDGFILHQCNCLCSKPKGLALSISDKYPYANPYINRKQDGNRNICIESDQDIPGTFKLFSKKDNPTFVGLFGQYDMGKVGKYYGERSKKYDDSTVNRLKWFKQSLFDFGEYIKNNYDNKQNVYMPLFIGCGMAFGKWSDYLPIIEEFQTKYKENINCVLVKFTN